ncbi:MAG: thiamine diphosphokinase [Granulosicoccus sp.]
MPDKNHSDSSTTGAASRYASSAWVFAGGDFHVDCIDPAWVAEGDIVVGVDHGISHCLDAGLVPDVMMGDFDSVEASVLDDARLAGTQRKTYPARKNSSDLELALDWLSDTQVERVVLLGISGGRSDHHMISWMLPSQERWQFAIEIIDATVHAHVVTPEHPLDAPAWIGQTVSLMPLPEASGVCTIGLEYTLYDAQLSKGTTLGLSNVASGKTIGVSISQGRLLAFRVNADKMPDSITR